MNDLNLIPKQSVQAEYPQHVVQSQAAAGTPGTCLSSRSLHPDTNSPGQWLAAVSQDWQANGHAGEGGAQRSFMSCSLEWTERPLGDKPPIDPRLTVALWGRR